jgi:hypothetical protein
VNIGRNAAPNNNVIADIPIAEGGKAECDICWVNAKNTVF